MRSQASSPRDASDASPPTSYAKTMKKILPLIIVIPASLSAAEFQYQGKVVKSAVSVAEADCGKFKVSLVVDEFPDEYQSDGSPRIIPLGLTLRHNETDKYVSADVYVFINGEKIKIPPVKEMVKVKPELLAKFARLRYGDATDAEYLPLGSPECTKNGFRAVYWIGGNGSGADYILTYQVLGREISLPGFMNVKELMALTKNGK